MNADLLRAAGNIVSNPQVLINVVRLRVRQLSTGSRPLVLAPPGSGTADIALMEIIHNKLTFATAVDANNAIPLLPVLPFLDPRAKREAA